MSNNKNISNLFESTTLVIIPKEEWLTIKANLLKILETLCSLQNMQNNTIPVNNITAVEFMAAVRIKRTKFDRLVAANKIKTIKKKRKIYVPVSEVDRYFRDPSIQ